MSEGRAPRVGPKNPRRRTARSACWTWIRGPLRLDRSKPPAPDSSPGKETPADRCGGFVFGSLRRGGQTPPQLRSACREKNPGGLLRLVQKNPALETPAGPPREPRGGPAPQSGRTGCPLTFGRPATARPFGLSVVPPPGPSLPFGIQPSRAYAFLPLPLLDSGELGPTRGTRRSGRRG